MGFKPKRRFVVPRHFITLLMMHIGNYYKFCRYALYLCENKKSMHYGNFIDYFANMQHNVFPFRELIRRREKTNQSRKSVSEMIWTSNCDFGIGTPRLL